jgi:hypothetical protein
VNQQALMNCLRTAALAAFAAIPGLSCTYSVSVPAIPASGGLVYVSVDTQRGCGWTVETGGFLSYYSARSGAGPGTAILLAQPDRGATRSTRVSVLYSGNGVLAEDFQAGDRGRIVAWTMAIQY